MNHPPAKHRLIPQLKGHVILFVDFQRGSYATVARLYESSLKTMGLDVEMVQTPQTAEERLFAQKEYQGCLIFHLTLGLDFQPVKSAVNIALPYHEWSRYPATWAQRLNTFDEIWVPSKHLASTLVESGVEAPIFFAPPALDLENIAEKSSWESRKPFRFFFCGEPHFRKGHHLLIEAFMRTFSSPGNAVLTIKTSPTCIWKSPRKDIVFIREEWSRNRLLSHYAEQDAFVSASLGEGLGLPLAEAILAKLPVATNNWGGHETLLSKDDAYFKIEHTEIPQPYCSLPEYFTPGQQCGFSSVDEISKTLQRVAMSDAQQRKDHAEHSQNHLLSIFGSVPALNRIAERLNTYQAHLDAQRMLHHA
tara:strand:+ start:739 stop:1827 length:1089 start_codon:yes stop_codon:yes gene_type:complete